MLFGNYAYPVAHAGLPVHGFIAAAVGGWPVFVMRQIVFDWQHGVLALEMHLRLENTCWQQKSIDAACAKLGQFRKQM